MPPTARLSLGAVLAAAVLMACGYMSWAAAQEIRAGDAQNGKTVAAHVGDTVTISLASTAWTFSGSSDHAVVQPQGEAVVSPAPPGTCPPGVGCGATSASFKAIKPGSATITAMRVSCGEAMRCVGSAGLYRVTISVS